MGVYDGIVIAREAQGTLQSLFFRPNKTIAIITQTQTDSITKTTSTSKREIDTDVVFSYNYNTSVEITKNPVESGVIINDHRIIQPQQLTIEVGFNNIVGISDIATNQDLGTLIQAGSLLIFGNYFDAKSRVAAKYVDLLVAMYNSDPFDIITPLGTFRDMLITNIESTQDGDTISAFRGVVSYQQIIKYEVKKRKITESSGVNRSENLGKISPQPIDQSLLPDGVRSIF